ncbi:MAG: enoyl-CoA hydratase/isomerase family protein [Deltaproteobacteria bacterium]|nr:enoyl-CoA hydratase/isomerase family protein [Deltaproteobacteria bacterium]
MLEVRNEGPVRLLRMNRPPANALNPELIAALREAVAAFGKEAEALVISGSPGMFSAGLDVPTLIQLDRETLAGVWADFYSLLQSLAASPIPVVAAITGHSPAGGAVIGVFCDRRIMAEGRFKIGLNEVRVGLSLPSAIYLALERLVGPRLAEQMATEGQLIDALEAHRVGLVNELAAADAVEERAVATCLRLLKLPRRALARTRQTARGPLLAGFEKRREQDLETVMEEWFSDETQQALMALVASLGKK